MSDDIFANLPGKAEELGPPVAHYRDRPQLFLWHTLLRVLMRLVLASTFLGWAILSYADAAGNPGPGAVVLETVLVAAAVVSLVSAVRVARRGLRRRGGSARGVVSCPGGLVCVLSDKVVVAPWDEIDSIWDGGGRFRTRGGAEVTLPDSLEDWPVVAELLYSETFQRLTICASATLLGGRAVEFGPITLTRDEIAVGRRRLAWADVDRVIAAGGRLAILGRGERLPALSVPLAEVPNVHALWALIERLRERGFGSIVIGPGASEPPEAD